MRICAQCKRRYIPSDFELCEKIVKKTEEMKDELPFGYRMLIEELIRRHRMNTPFDLFYTNSV